MTIGIDINTPGATHARNIVPACSM